MPATDVIAHRYDFVYLFDVADGNPNGDPDAGNQPRIDPETGEGLVTDVCLKRKVRNAVPLLAAGRPGYDIYFQTQDAPNDRRVLNKLHQEAHDAVGAPPSDPPAAPAAEKTEKPKGKGKDRGPDKQADTAQKAREWMCNRYFDVRAFGAVMTTGVNCGQVRGPVQLTFARSVGPILALEHAITRKSVTTPEDAEAQIKKDGTITGTMGRKMTVPYALYKAHGFVTPQLAGGTNGTGFTDADLALLWDALCRMFEFDRSATRGQMAARGLYVFKHQSPLGNAAAHKLQGLVTVERLTATARSFADFRVTAPTADHLPKGVELLTFDCESFGAEPHVVAAG